MLISGCSSHTPPLRFPTPWWGVHCSRDIEGFKELPGGLWWDTCHWLCIPVQHYSPSKHSRGILVPRVHGNRICRASAGSLLVHEISNRRHRSLKTPDAALHNLLFPAPYPGNTDSSTLRSSHFQTFQLRGSSKSMLLQETPFQAGCILAQGKRIHPVRTS